MGRYYRVGLKDKSEKSIQKVNQILEEEFNAPVKIYPDGFKEAIMISGKYLKDEFDYVKTHKHYEQFFFLDRIKQADISFKEYCDCIAYFLKRGYSQQFKISSLYDADQAKQVVALSEMVDNNIYKDLFITNNAAKFINYETKELVYFYCKHLL